MFEYINFDNKPPLYENVYYSVRFYKGNELYKEVSKIIKAIERKKVSPALKRNISDEMIEYIEKGVPEQEIEMIKMLLAFRYNDTDIHPKYENFYKYISKTKKSTNVDIRKKIREVIFKTEFIHALSKAEVKKIKELFKELVTEEMLKEVDALVIEEENRILSYQKGESKRKRIGAEINRELAIIAPKIIEKSQGKKDFFSKLRFRKNKIGFFTMQDVGKDYEIVSEFLKQKQAKSERIFLEFDDENENFFVKLSDHYDLAFVGYILQEGVRILGLPIQEIIWNCRHKGMPITEPQWHEIKPNQFYESIKRGAESLNGLPQKFKLYSEESIRIVIDQLMKTTKCKTELHLACFLHFNYLLPIRTYTQKRREYFEKHDINSLLSFDEFKKKKEEIYQQMIMDGKIKAKWKNELDLYKLVAKYFPDAIYQYRSDWLEGQSLDIFIPTLKVGIEYQGQQHYEPIEFFGGEEAFLYRQKLDTLKTEKCRANQVNLIHWHYQDVISKTNLDRKLKNMNNGE